MTPTTMRTHTHKQTTNQKEREEADHFLSSRAAEQGLCHWFGLNKDSNPIMRLTYIKNLGGGRSRLVKTSIADAGSTASASTRINPTSCAGTTADTGKP